MRPFLRLTALCLLTVVFGLPALCAWALTLGGRGPGVRLSMWAMHGWARLVLRALGVRVRTEGRPPEGAALFASNHLGYLDILVLASLYPSLFVSMAELAGWPLVGTLARAVGTIFIDRARPSEVGRVRQEMARRLRQGLPLTLFPESRPSPGTTVQRFHAALFESAIEAGAPCVPVALGFECDEEATPATAVCWWGEMAFGPHFRRLLRLRGVEARVAFGPPIAPVADRKELANRVHAEVLARFAPVRQAPAGGAPPRS